MEALKARTPAFRLRSEFETEKIIHRHNVRARKVQIELVKLDNEHPWQPYNFETYAVASRRTHFFKVMSAYLRYYFLQLKP